MPDITTKEIYNLVEQVETRLGIKIEKVYDAFLRLEEGKVTELLESRAKQEAELRAIRAEYKPVKQVVYGLVGLVLTIVLTALVYLVIKK